MKLVLPRQMLKGRDDGASFYHEWHESHEWVAGLSASVIQLATIESGRFSATELFIVHCSLERSDFLKFERSDQTR